MKAKRLTALALALFLLAAANLRRGCAVSVSGVSAPGVYTESEARRSLRSAAAAQEEIARFEASPPLLETRRILTLRSPQGDTAALTRLLLDNSEGVSRAWRVTVDGLDAGLCSDPTALGEVIELLIAERAVPEAVAASLTADVQARAVYVPCEAESDLMAVAAMIRGGTRVMSVTSDGTVRYG